eukprot:TRINITY_DN1222_c0_g1_i2.p1 TRINITY_DN1222_c0_g1~~TRINITY_DN1222_c0_g1_i2.p1  ORF type:complete len:229 (+),score=56.39 TRINITY_DN1222_c0_g1_i2:56-742(+)
MGKQGPTAAGAFKCNICNVSCSSKSALDSHMTSKRHLRNAFQLEAKKKALENPVEADVKSGEKSKCTIIAGTSDGSAAVKEEATGEIKASVKGAATTEEENQAANGNAPERMKCELCKIVCQDQAAYDFHISTNRHKKREAAMKMQFKCEVCCVGTNTQLMLEKHMESKNHKAQVEKNKNRRWAIRKLRMQSQARRAKKRKNDDDKKRKSNRTSVGRSSETDQGTTGE